MITKGTVVKSKAGRDSGTFCVVIDILPDGSLYLCDGVHHKLSNPKPKNVKHIAATNTVLKPDEYNRDSDIIHALKSFNGGI